MCPIKTPPAIDPNACEQRENERAELAIACDFLIEACQEAFARSRVERSPDVLRHEFHLIHNATVDFVRAVLEHVRAEHVPGAAADALHAAARMEEARIEGLSPIGSSRTLRGAAKAFKDAERERWIAKIAGVEKFEA